MTYTLAHQRFCRLITLNTINTMMAINIQATLRVVKITLTFSSITLQR